ncbi:hypothetical protein B0T17DRAFT_67614 [Bombardia bombarda]|uniref:CorA-like transporter domain-containing protein n=1 Tax=Bombardia bombarda TaxID=252184 RepID=A0AA39XLZ5_9PEZI|nr:hypothetical protein B0T17DRAFT_67614 [Bombardia bombarda]
MTAFRHEDYLDRSSSIASDSPLRIQHCFNLISVKHDKVHDEWPWPLRQTAVHHSFEPKSGRATWMSLKGNTEIASRLNKSIPAHPQLRPST